MTLLRPNSTGHGPTPVSLRPAITNADDWRAQAWLFLRSHGNKVPPALACPISYGLMLDPVSVANGQTYDRPSIGAWFASPAAVTENGRFIDPLTRDVLDAPDLHPNLTVRAQVTTFKDAVLGIDPNAAHYFERSNVCDTITAPRRPRRYMTGGWAQRHSAQPPAPPHYPRGGSPQPAAEAAAMEPIDDITAHASRTVDRALASVSTHPWPGLDAEHLRAHLDDIAAWRNRVAEETAQADADDEIRELREAMGVTSDAQDSGNASEQADDGFDTRGFARNPETPIDSDDEIERELNDALWHI